MNKRIRFDRVEDVRMYYASVMEEEDWPEFMDWMRDAYPVGADRLKDLSFEDVVANLENQEAEPITWEQPYDSYPSGDPTTYTESLTDVMREYLRDSAIDDGAFDEDYYDDSGEENISIENV